MANITNVTSMMMVRHKMVFVGDVFVGKTSIMNKICEADNHDTYEVHHLNNYIKY